MNYLFYILLVGLNIFPFISALIDKRADIWTSQGMWAQTMVMGMISYSLFKTAGYKAEKNLPLFLLNLWVGLFTAFICFVAQVNGKYDILHFFPYFNFLCILFLYKLATEYLNSYHLSVILEVMKWCVIANLLICVLQIFNISQFFGLVALSPVKHLQIYNNNIVTGVMANGTHLSGFLGMCVPLFFVSQERQDYLCLLLLCVVLFYTGTNVGDPAMAGFITALASTGAYLYQKNKMYFFYFSIFFITTCLILIALCFQAKINLDFFSDNGRFEAWRYYFNLWKSQGMTLTGYGLGTIAIIYNTTPYPHLKHLHMEYFQYIFEIGLIGLTLILWVIKDAFSSEIKDNDIIVFRAILFGFLVNCLFCWSSHLWMPSIFAVLCYSAIYVHKRGDLTI